MALLIERQRVPGCLLCLSVQIFNKQVGVPVLFPVYSFGILEEKQSKPAESQEELGNEAKDTTDMASCQLAKDQAPQKNSSRKK